MNARVYADFNRQSLLGCQAPELTLFSTDSVATQVRFERYSVLYFYDTDSSKCKRSTNAATLLVSGRDMEYQELTLQFNNLVWELVERKNSEDIHKAELPKFLFRVVDFMESLAKVRLWAAPLLIRWVLWALSWR